MCDGDQLELICSLTDPGSSLLAWTFAPATIFMGLFRAIDAHSLNDDTPWMINSTLFSFSRISARDNLPLVSRLTIDPLTTGLNGIMINCTDVSMREIASTVVYVMNRGTFIRHWVLGAIMESGKMIMYCILSLDNFTTATLLINQGLTKDSKRWLSLY